jgi:hypothetical protein
LRSTSISQINALGIFRWHWSVLVGYLLDSKVESLLAFGRDAPQDLDEARI